MFVPPLVHQKSMKGAELKIDSWTAKPLEDHMRIYSQSYGRKQFAEYGMQSTDF